MKKNIIKQFFITALMLTVIFTLAISSSAATIQDRIQNYINQKNNPTSSQSGSSSNGQVSSDVLNQVQDFFSGLSSSGGNTNGNFSEEVQKFWDVVSGTDIGSVISEFDLQKLYNMGQEAWKSGIDMIKDAIGGGLGTSSSSNTGTTVPQTTRAVATTYVITYDTTPTVTTPQTIVTVPQTTEPSTVQATAPVLQEPEPITSAAKDDSSISTASKVVIAIMSVATIAVIVCMVIFFVIKKK